MYDNIFYVNKCVLFNKQSFLLAGKDNFLSGEWQFIVAEKVDIFKDA